MTFKAKIKALKYSRFLISRWIFLFFQSGKVIFYSIFYKSKRWQAITKIRYGKYYLQRPATTMPNRYPALFNVCSTYLSKVKEPSILSFGCSTGEEVFSLGKQMPQAHILGVDINPWCIRQARKKSKNPNHLFTHRLSKEFERADEFDAIFCMAVFQRTENRTNDDNSLADGFLFEQFENEIKMLDKKLKPGGLIIIDNSDFRLMDTSVSKQYEPLASFDQNKIIRNRPVFDRNNRKISDKNEAYRVFVKN